MAESKLTQQQQAAKDRRAAATGAAAGEVVKAAVLSSAQRAAVLAKVTAAASAFLVALKASSDSFLRDLLQGRGPLDDVEAVLREEQDREKAFADGVMARLKVDLPRVLALPTQSERELAIRTLMDREQRYVSQRVQAVSARVVAAIDRKKLRRSSPRGAFWELDPLVKEHTAGCLVMGNKFWPWKVLDRVHPPRHYGCPCRLRSEGDALKSGLMRAGDVLDVSAAVRAASDVVMEREEAELLARELEQDAVIEALVGCGLASREDLDALVEAGLEVGSEG